MENYLALGGKASKFGASLSSVPLGDTLKTPNQQTALLPNFGNILYFQKFLKFPRSFYLIKMDQKIDLVFPALIYSFPLLMIVQIKHAISFNCRGQDTLSHHV